MGTYSIQATRANLKLDSAIKKIEAILGSQRGLIQYLSDNPEVISSYTTPKLENLNAQLIRLANIIDLLKQDIAQKGLQLDIDEEKRIRAAQIANQPR